MLVRAYKHTATLPGSLCGVAAACIPDVFEGVRVVVHAGRVVVSQDQLAGVVGVQQLARVRLGGCICA